MFYEGHIMKVTIVYFHFVKGGDDMVIEEQLEMQYETWSKIKVNIT